MNYRAVLYDMDGTVLDTLEDLKNAVNAALAAFGRPALTLEQVRAYVGNGSRRLIELALGEGAAPEEIDRMLAWYKPWYDAHCRILTRPYPGILSLMERLKAAGVRQAIVSNKPDSAVRALAGDFFNAFGGQFRFTGKSSSNGARHGVPTARRQRQRPLA